MAGKEMMKAVMRNEKIEVNRNGMVIVGHAGMVGRMQKKLLIHLSQMTRGHPIRRRIDKKIGRPRKTGRIDDDKTTRIPCLVNPGLERVTDITRDVEGRKTLRRRRQVLQAQVRLPLRAIVTALIMVKDSICSQDSALEVVTSSERCVRRLASLFSIFTFSNSEDSP